MEDIAAALVPINQPVVACNLVSFPLYKNPICAPEVGKVEDVWLTVVEHVIVGEDKVPKLREEQVSVPQVIVPEVFKPVQVSVLQATGPHSRVFDPIASLVFNTLMSQQVLNVSVYTPPFTEWKVRTPPSFCLVPPPIAPP